MTMTISNRAVEAVIKGEQVKDRETRIAELEKQLAKVKKDIVEQERLDKRWATVQRAFDKLRRELGKTLTPEEYQAIDGAYIFLHSGCVDLLRRLPALTSRGEDKRLLKDLDMAEAMKELSSLTK